jgi:hypothetical protein
MKLSKLREEINQHQDDQMANDKFVQAVKKYRSKYIFWKVINVPEGEIHSTIRIEDIPFTPERFKENHLGEITCDIDFKPNMDSTPIIPTNLLTICVEDFVDSIMEVDPETKNIPKEILNMYDFKIQRVNMFPLNGIFHLKDMMETPTWNTKVSAPRHFGELFHSRPLLLSTYGLEPTDLPTFSDDYAPYMKKVLKKAYNVFLALRKGTWKGHTYELDDYEVKRSGFVVHQDHNSYNKQDKVIHPDFKVATNFGWELIDGIKNSPETSPLSEEEQKEFRQYLRTRFSHFGIEY